MAVVIINMKGIAKGEESRVITVDNPISSYYKTKDVIKEHKKRFLTINDEFKKLNIENSNREKIVNDTLELTYDLKTPKENYARLIEKIPAECKYNKAIYNTCELVLDNDIDFDERLRDCLHLIKNNLTMNGAVEAFSGVSEIKDMITSAFDKLFSSVAKNFKEKAGKKLAEIENLNDEGNKKDFEKKIENLHKFLNDTEAYLQWSQQIKKELEKISQVIAQTFSLTKSDFFELKQAWMKVSDSLHDSLQTETSIRLKKLMLNMYIRTALKKYYELPCIVLDINLNSLLEELV